MATAVAAADTFPKLLAAHARERGLTNVHEHDLTEPWPITEKSARAVVLLDVIEHVPDPVSVLRACASLLKPGGRLFLSTLNRTPKAFAFGIVGAEYLLGLLPRGTHRYERFLRPSEIRRALVALGFERIEFQGLRYNPFTRRAERNADLSINYLVAAARSC